MKVFFDTNVYVAEALLGEGTERMVAATHTAKWRIFVSEYLLDELERVLTQYLGFSRRLAYLTRARCRGRAMLVDDVPSRHAVPGDPGDNPILQAARRARVDYLVTNDTHLLALGQYEGTRILSLSEYYQLLQDRGMIVE